MIFWLLPACFTDPEPPPPVTFVRDGLMGGARASAGPGSVQARPWTPGSTIEGSTAPKLASCVAIAEVALGDLSGPIAAGIPAPDTATAFSPDGRWLAVGTWLGELWVVDGWTGEVRARRVLAESAVKQVAWSPDGAELYAAEQSVDGFLHALDPESLATRASFRLADELASSAPPARGDLYGLYTLPAAYGLQVRADGDLMVVGAHGWTTAEGRQNRSRVWRLRRTEARFEVVAAWPEAVADATFLTAHLHDDGLLVAVGRSSPGPAPASLPVGGVARLDGMLQLVGTAEPPPLTPWFDRAFIWEAMGLHGERLTLGLADGRVWRPEQSRDLGTPILAGEVPISATIGQLVDRGTEILVLTSGTSIPYGSGRTETQPPEAHPRENTLFGLDPTTLETVWTWRGGPVAGLTVGERWTVLGVGGEHPEAHGVMVFDNQRTGSGSDRLAAQCVTGQPVFFRTAIAPDGRLAVVSFPAVRDDKVFGDYRLTIFR